MSKKEIQIMLSRKQITVINKNHSIIPLYFLRDGKEGVNKVIG